MDAWWIGLLGGGEAGRSPKGARKRGGLDVEAAGKQAEVQKEQESVNCTPCQGHDGYNYLPNFYPANKGFIPVFVY